MIKLADILNEENWKADKGVITFNGEAVGDYSFDRDADGFFIDDISGRGSKGFDTKVDMIAYIKKNKAAYLKARKAYVSRGYMREDTSNEDLRKWFGKGGTGSSSGGGWDRYNSTGKKVGKCGDSKGGSAYAACLSKEKAAKLGPDGRASFVKRKRSAQSKAGDSKKGGEQSKGQKPTYVKTGASESAITERQFNGMKNVPNNTSLEDVSKDIKLNIIKSKGNIINFKVPASHPKPRVAWQVISTGKIQKTNDGNYILVGAGQFNFNSPPFKSIDALIDGVNWKAMEYSRRLNESIKEDWSQKYKKSINCSNPKGFSQKAHCAGKRKNEDMEIKKLTTEQKMELFLEKNVPTDPAKWSASKAAAKKKFDVYPSAYANGWAAKNYKAKGGGWKTQK